MKYKLIILLSLLCPVVFGQNYTSYFTGNTTNIETNPIGGICMMGGASEHNEAMRWFLERANGGDILVLRTSGSNGYNDYMFSELGITVNSVETIVFNNATASNESYIHQKIQQAEAIWFAGGNQWNYINYWRNTQIQTLINEAIQDRNITIGGTSAGMAILGGYYFSAQNGTVTSATALANPYNSSVTVDNSPFLENDILSDVITDTHYDDPNRKGRHVVFLARVLVDTDVTIKGIACNEYTAVCIDENNIASVYGDYPAYEESAFFLQTNCELTDFNPENCTENNPLVWNLNGTAIRVCKVNGTNNGENTFDLNDWKTTSGGIWQNWYVDDGILIENKGAEINCSSLLINDDELKNLVAVFPNPFINEVTIKSEEKILELTLFDLNGNLVGVKSNLNEFSNSINTNLLISGIYFIKIQTINNVLFVKILKK